MADHAYLHPNSILAISSRITDVSIFQTILPDIVRIRTLSVSPRRNSPFPFLAILLSISSGLTYERIIALVSVSNFEKIVSADPVVGWRFNAKAVSEVNTNEITNGGFDHSEKQSSIELMFIWFNWTEFIYLKSKTDGHMKTFNRRNLFFFICIQWDRFIISCFH